MIFDVLSVDPGEDLGWGGFNGKELIGCGLEHIDTFRAGGRHLVIEKPEIYPTMKIDANDLITLAILAGRVIERVRAQETREVLPKEWKGQVPKPKHKGEMYIIERRIRGILTMKELKIYETGMSLCAPGQRHNVTDGVGIGLSHLGRYRR